MGEKKGYVNVLGYDIFASDINKCIEEVFKYEKVHIVSGNPEVLFVGLNNKVLYENFISNNALIIPDGVGVQIAAKIMKTPVKEKIAGIDLMKRIISKCEKNNEGIYLLGADEESLNACREKILLQYPNINILGYHNGFFDLNNCEDLISDIKEKKPTAIFVAMGCPRQEQFIVKYMDELPVKIFMGVGGSFDVIANKVKRAPKWMIKIGMEWAYRVFKEPWRIKRLGSIPKFLWLAVKYRGKEYEGQ